MKLGLDILHIRGKHQAKMLELAQDTFKRGGRVYIITEDSAEDTRKEIIQLMALYRISKPFWSMIYSTIDWMIHNKVPHYKDKDGSLKALRAKDWNALRGNISKEIGLDLYIGYEDAHSSYFDPGVFVLMK